MSKITKNGFLKIGDVAKLLGVSIQTLRRWDASGRLAPITTPGGTRLYTRESLVKIDPNIFHHHVQEDPGPSLNDVKPHKTTTTADLKEILIPAVPVSSRPPSRDLFDRFRVKPGMTWHFIPAVLAAVILVATLGANIYINSYENKLADSGRASLARMTQSLQSVLAENAAASSVEINADTNINGNISAYNLKFATELDQSLTKASSPTFSALTLTAPSAQFNLPSGSKITIPDATGILVLTDNTQTLTNKKISGSANTLSNIPNSALSNSKITITPGSNLTGGGDVNLGSSIVLSVKDNPVFASVSAGLLYVNGDATISGNLLPAENGGNQNLGSADYYWNSIYVNNVFGPPVGSFWFWQRAGGVVSPASITDDLAVGGSSTASAKFQVFGLTGNVTGGTYNGQTISSLANFTGTVNIAGNLTTGGSASISGGLILYNTNTIQSTANQTLILGGNTTGNVVISPNNTTVATFGPTGLNMNNLPIVNIGNSGTDFGSDGSLTLANALTVTSGGIGVTSGGITVTAGGIGVTAGNITLSSGQSISSAGTMSLSTNDWGISTTGALTGISGITNDGSYTQTGVSTNTFTGATTILNAASVSGTLSMAGNILPVTDSFYDLGSASFQWNNIYARNIITPGAGVSGYWQRADGVVAPTNITDDLIIGATATASAKFQVFGLTGNVTGGTYNGQTISSAANFTGTVNVAGNLTTTGNASISGGLTFFGTPGIQSTANQSLVIGGNTTGNVVIAPNNTTVATFTAAGLNMNNLPILNIGNSGTDFGTDGSLTLANKLTVTSGGIEVTSGGMTIQNGTLTINDGGGMVMAGGQSISSAGTISLSTNDWGISTTGALTGISGISNDAGYTQTGNTANTFSGPTTIANTASISGALTLYGTPTISTTAKQSLILGDANTGNIDFVSKVGSNILPATDSFYDLGSASFQWNNIYARNIITPGVGIAGYWQRTAGSVAPTNITDSLNLGATATSSALIHLGGTANEDSFFNTGGLVTFGGVTAFTPVAAPGITTGKLYNLTGNLAWNGSAICTAAGNCAGTSSSLGGSGSAGYIAKWNGTYTLTTSLLYDTGTEIQISGNATTSGNLVFSTNPVIGTTAKQSLTLGDANTGDLNFYSSANKLTSAGNLTLAGTINATGIQTGATTRIDTSGNLTNIGTASMSGALTFTTTPTIQSTSNQTLTLGGDSTGNIILKPNNVTLATFTPTDLDMNNLPILNIGNAGTDFSSQGGLTLANALTVTSGGIGVTSGGITVTAGGIGVTAGNISLTGSQTISATGDLTIQSGGSNNLILTGQYFGVNASGNVTAGTYNSQTISSAANFTGTATVSGTLGVGGNTTLQGDLSVKGNTNLITGSAYQINGANVLSATTLGAGVTGSSLTSVGTLTSLAVSGNATMSGNLTFDSAASIQTTKNQTLTIGGDSTGNIILKPNNVTLATFTPTDLDMNNLPILNIGNAGTDFGTNGSLTLANALTVSSGGIGVTSGGITVTAGGIGVTAGNISLTGSQTISATGDLTVESGGSNNLILTGANFAVNSVGVTTLNSLAYTWPSSQAANGVLTTNGSGTLSWANPAGGTGVLGFWQRTSGSLAPTNITDSINLGATATTSALVHLAGTAAENSWINTGNVGIGTTVPLAKLDVNGTASISGTLTINAANPIINTTNDRPLQFFGSANTIDVNGNLILNGNVTAGTYNSATLNGTTLSGTSSYTITGGTGSGNTLTLVSSSHGTKGNIQFFDTNTYITPAGNLVLAGSLTATSATISGTLGVGGNTTLQADLSVKGNTNLITGSAYQINGTNVLGAATLGTGVTGSSLTSTGILVGGSIASGFGTIATANTITGTTINGTTGINTGATAGTNRIDVSGNLLNIGNITATGTLQNTGTATISGTLGVGGNTTINADLAVKGNVNITTAAGFYQINGTNVLSGTVLGTGVVTSSLTTVGALASGSIASGFGTIATANTITGTTLNGTTGINTGATAGTQRIDVNGNLLNIGTASMSGALTLTTTPTIGTTSMQVLTLGGANTGSVQLSPKSTTGLFVDGSGNVGIGTTGPGAKLQVNGNMLLDAPAYDGLTIADSTGNARLDLYQGNSAGYIHGYSGSSIDFQLNAGGNSWLNATQGNVGIGTTSPQGKLDVAGTAYSTSGTWSGSDIRWKENVQPIAGALDKVLQLQGVTFDWNKTAYPNMGFIDGTQMGLIAQQIEPIVPEVVSTNSNGYKSVEYGNLAALLIEGIKEQQGQIASVSSQLTTLSDVFQVDGTGSIAIKGNRNFGIGTTSPGYLLTVNSSTPGCNGCTLWTNYSDKRLKENINTLPDDILGKIMELNPINFNYNDLYYSTTGYTRPGGVTPSYAGFVAQQLQTVFPEMVSQGPNGYLDTNLSNLQIYLVKGIQEQQGEIASQSAQIATISATLANLPEDISAKIALIPQIQDQIASLSAQMASVSGRLAKAEEQIASPSALLGVAMTPFTNIDISTVSASFANFSESLKVAGTTQLANTTIGGSLQVGLLHFDDLKAEISSLTGTVSILGDATVSGQLRVGKGIVLKDKTTLEDYCVQVDNGEIIKTKGACQ